MQCPNCHHALTDEQIKCSACGHVSATAALEKLQNLEYLVAWLDEHEGEVAAGSYHRLHQDAAIALAAAHGHLALAAPGAPELAASPTFARPAAEVALELQLVTDIRDSLETWAGARVIQAVSTESLRRYLNRQRQELNAALGGRVSEVPLIAQKDVIAYAQRALPEWKRIGLLSPGDGLSLAAYLQKRQETILARQFAAAPATAPAALEPAASPAFARPVEQVVREMVLTMDTLDLLPQWVQANAISYPSADGLRRLLTSHRQQLNTEKGGRTAEIKHVKESDILDCAQHCLETGQWAEAILPGDRLSLVVYLQNRHEPLVAPMAGAVPVTATAALPPAPKPVPQPAPQLAVAQPAMLRPQPAVASQMVAAPARPKPAPAPARPAPRPAKPPRPPINWGEIWERGWQLVVSGALLRGLLYLGALMIVASAVVLVVRFWSDFPGWLKIGFVAAVPVSFYAGGFILRRLKIPVAGSAFTGIGALLVAVDLAAIYQLGGLSRVVDLPLYWLGSALFCAALYLFTLYRARGEFFGHLTLIGGGNVAIALAVALHLRPEWWVAAGAAAGLGMVAVAAALKGRSGAWQDLARPARYLSQLVLPAAVFLVAAVALFVTPRHPWALAATLVLVAVGYGGLAWRFAYRLAEYAAVGSSVLAGGFALSAMGLPGEWWAGSGAAASAAYSVAGRWLDWRRRAAPAAQRLGRWAWYGAAGLIAVIGWGSGLISLSTRIWPAIIGQVFLVALLVGWARLFRRPLFSFAASGLFLVPFTAAIVQWFGHLSWLPLAGWVAVAWTALALGYLALAASLRAAERHARWPFFWAHLITGLACTRVFVLIPISRLGAHSAAGTSLATLATLTGAIAVYTASAWLHDSRRHPALSGWVAWLKPAADAAFLWPLGLLTPAWLAAAWWCWALPWGWAWFGAALAGLALIYVGLGQLLARRRAAYRLPWHTFAYGLAAIGSLLALGTRLPLAVTLYLAVAVLAALAWAHRRPLETFLAAALFVAPFQLTLNLAALPLHTDALAYALLAALAYYPLGLGLRRARGGLAWPVLGVGYAVAAASVVVAVLGPLGLLGSYIPGLAIAALLVVLALLIASTYHLRHPAFAWAAAVVLPLTYWQVLKLLGLSAIDAAAAWVGLAFAGLLLERLIAARTKAGHWLRVHVEPQRMMSVIVCALGLSLTGGVTFFALTGLPVAGLLPAMLAQTLSVAFVILAARLHHSRWPLYAAPVLSFVAVTLFFIAYSAALFGQPFTAALFGLPWMGLALACLLAAALLDPQRERYSHGLYAGGYLLTLLAVGWTVRDAGVLFWTLGLGLAAASASASLVRANRHHTWDELIAVVFGKGQSAERAVVRGAFWWLAAWPLPIWSVLLLRQLGVTGGFQWLGFGLAALLLLGLAQWLGRGHRFDAWPFHSAAQFYTAVGLLITAPITLAALSGAAGANLAPFGIIPLTAALLMQTLAVVFYAASARVSRRLGFAHLAAWLSFVPYTLGWILYSGLSAAQFALPWLALAVVLLAVGLALDRAKVRYAHGPYLSGYALALFAVVWSTPDRAVQIIALGTVVLIALASQTLVHFRRHHSFDDLINWLWRIPDTPSQRAARIAFLFFAAYVFPFFLTQLLAYWAVPLAWRGLALALAAPLYIALGLAGRRAWAEYTWPLYSAGYALTALGAMLTFENEALAIYVLALDLVVYAASAVIFRQAFWLYLANLLLPVIVLVTLHHNHALAAPWVAGLFMDLAYAYLIVGRWLMARRAAPGRPAAGIAPMALPFVACAYLLSAVALAAATGERGLALAVFSAGVMLYAFSAWTFREPLFLYPAAWLAAVPYYLALTLTSLPPEWLGLGWLPFIVVYVGLGRFVFQTQAPTPASPRAALGALTRASAPFYLLAYALSAGMVVTSQRAPWPLTLALAAAAALYFGSARLFRRAAWLYPALLTTHLALLSFLAAAPSSLPAFYLSVPFMGLTWVIVLAGLLINRLRPVASPAASPAPRLSLSRLPVAQRLLTPSWSRPFFLFAALDLVLWQAVALLGLSTGQLVAVGFMLLLALLAVLWRDVSLRYGALGLFLVAVGYSLASAGVSLPDGLTGYAGLGFGLYWLAQAGATLADHWPGRSRWAAATAAVIAEWVQPLTRVALITTPLAALGSLAFVLDDSHTSGVALALGFAGALYLAVAYRGRLYNLGYAALATLEVAWALLLLAHDVSEPQWYAIPAGLYFAGLAFFERHRGRHLFANAVEGLGLAVLLVTSFIQSLNGGAAGLPYFVLLILEGLLAVWWGAGQRLKIPFFVGLAAEAINVGGQVLVLFMGGETALRWIIIGATGLTIVAAAVFVERQRERLIVRAHAWREALETWA